eukprot:1180229-Prorocentrum_minimum.AAC.5
MRVAATSASGSYVRIHRRAGKRERLLQDEEIAEWAVRLKALHPQLNGPCYFLWVRRLKPLHQALIPNAPAARRAVLLPMGATTKALTPG